MMVRNDAIALSVLIPVYETPVALVKESVRSAASICGYNVEVLLADDGNRKELADELDVIAAAYDNVGVLHLPHGGVSAARNAALTEAKGIYITFLDADDLLFGDAVEEVLAICEAREPQLLISRISRSGSPRASGKHSVLEAGASLRRDLRVYYTTLNDTRFRDSVSLINRAPHGRFLKRELAEQCMMREELGFGEDVIWNFDLLNHAERILVSDHVTYCYKEQPFSATQKKRTNFPGEVKKLLKYYRKEIGTWPAPDRKYFYTAAVEYFTILMRLYVFAGDDGNARNRFREVFSDPDWKKVFSRCRPDTLNGRYLITGILGKSGCGTGLFLTGLIYDRMVRKRALAKKSVISPTEGMEE